MTKNIRIENADTSAYKVTVEVWEIRDDGNILMETRQLSNPTDMATLAIWSNRYLVIKEA